MGYQDLIDNLNRRGIYRIQPGLQRVQQVLKLLSNPHDNLKTIHIAGTNGKGSVAAFLESVLRHAGFRTGLYTSPHLVNLRERIQVDRQFISTPVFSKSAEAILHAEQISHICLTYFEFLTVLAFKIFKDQNVDIAVIETGLGGRWDATNVLSHPELSVITSIGLDHTEWLGRSERMIAREKAGIIKNHGFLISGVEDPGQRVISRVARQKHAMVWQRGRDFRTEGREISWEERHQTIDYWGPQKSYTQATVGLLGSYQVDNVGVALAAIDALRQKGWTIQKTAISTGLARVAWPGRCQVVKASESPTILFDGAHNPPGLARLMETLQQSHWRDKPKSFVIGVYRDKNYHEMAKMIAPYASRVTICQLPGSRALSGKKLLTTCATHLPQNSLLLIKDPKRALQTTKERTEKEGIIIVTGSLALIGMLLPRLKPFHPLSPQGERVGVRGGVDHGDLAAPHPRLSLSVRLALSPPVGRGNIFRRLILK